MLNELKRTSEIAFTQNGAVTYASTRNMCLDLFFSAGAMRNRSQKDIANAVIRAYYEDPSTAMKILFYARDVRGGLGERRFFRTAMHTLAFKEPEAVIRNIRFFGEYGRFDDLCVLLDTPCEKQAVDEISRQLNEDLSAMENSGRVSLLAKWLPSVNASSEETCSRGRHLAKLLGMTPRDYRRKLSALRRYCDILENRLRERDYTFEYSKQPSAAMLKYRNAFIRNDGARYGEYISAVNDGKATINTATLYPYDIVRSCDMAYSPEERAALNAAWQNLPVYGEKSGNALAVIDCSGSMTWSAHSNVKPIDAALSLGIYIAERNTGRFAGHFVTFSETPRLVEIKGNDIAAKVSFCRTYNEVANTNIEAVFRLILKTAVKNKLPQEEMPETLYIISDMEFDCCIDGGNDITLFETMKELYRKNGYTLPKVVFWNVNSFRGNFPVGMSETGAALVSGFSPSLFDMVLSGEISPIKIMLDIIGSERYAAIA